MTAFTAIAAGSISTAGVVVATAQAAAITDSESTGKWFDVTDSNGDFIVAGAGDTIIIIGTASSDGVYTIVTVADQGGGTVRVVVSETVAADNQNGNAYPLIWVLDGDDLDVATFDLTNDGAHLVAELGTLEGTSGSLSSATALEVTTEVAGRVTMTGGAVLTVSGAAATITSGSITGAVTVSGAGASIGASAEITGNVELSGAGAYTDGPLIVGDVTASGAGAYIGGVAATVIGTVILTGAGSYAAAGTMADEFQLGNATAYVEVGVIGQVEVAPQTDLAAANIQQDKTILGVDGTLDPGSSPGGTRRVIVQGTAGAL